MNRKTMAILSYLFYFFIFAIILLIIYFIAFKTDKKINNKETTTTTTLVDVKIKLNKEKISLKLDESVKLKATIYPNNAGNIIFSSSDENVAVVDNKGIIKAVGVGTAKIIVSVSDYSTEAICEVNVVEENILATSIFLNDDSVRETVGNTYQIEATVIPMNSSDKLISYKSSDDYVASVDNNGLVTFNNKGSCIITVYLTNHPEINSEVEFIVSK